LLDVLLAQRALFDAQRQLAQSQASFHQIIVELERFTGIPVEPAQSPYSSTAVEKIP
jgi:outer membrane protein TolC